MRRITRQSLFGAGLLALLAVAPGATLRAQNPPPAADKTAPNPAKPAATKPAKPAVKTTAKKPDPAHAKKIAAKPAKPKPGDKKLAAAPNKPTDRKSTATAAAPAKPQVARTNATAVDNLTYLTTRAAPAPAARPAARVAAVPAALPQPAVATASAATAAPGPQQPGRAAAFVANFLNEAFRIARSAGETSLQHRAQLAELFTEKLDGGRMAVSTTANELNATSADFQRRFRTILISYLVETYYPRIELASDSAVKVDTLAATPLPDGTLVVWTTFSKSGWPPQSVKWHLAAAPDGFKIVDIFSAGASLVQMERDTFISVMRNGGLPELMAKLDARTKALASAAP
jgi:ABC-type transporter MlaC component